MTDRKIYLARHGEPIYTESERFIGRTDLDLSENGEKQIQWLAQQMAEVKLSAVYTSPLLRCRKTAAAVAKSHGLEPIIVEGIIEIDLGEWEEKTVAQIQEGWPDHFANRRNDMANFSAPGGETWGAVQKRVSAVMDQIAKTAPPGPIFVAAHKGANLSFICNVMDLPLDLLFNFDQDYGCLNLIQYQQGKPRIEMLNFTGQEMPEFEVGEEEE